MTTSNYDTTPSPDMPPVPSRGRMYIMISELNERYLGLASGYLQPSSAQRTARQEMTDIQAEIKELYRQIGAMKK